MGQFSKNAKLFTQKIVTKLSKIWVWDPGSGKNLFRFPVPDPVVKKAPDPGSGSAKLIRTHNKIILFRLCCVPTSLSAIPANSGLTSISQTHKAHRSVTFYFKGEQLSSTGSNNQGHGDGESITLEFYPLSAADPYSLKTGSGSGSRSRFVMTTEWQRPLSGVHSS